MFLFSSLFKTENKKPYTFGLALSGGGVKGFAHLGVFKALEEKAIKPEVIAGTSAGALAGVLYADGYSPDEIFELFNGKTFKKFAELTMLRSGIFKPDRLHSFLKKTLRAKKFKDLRIPLKVIATDLVNGKSVIFQNGNIIEPILASCAYPVIFTPIEINNNHYIDGGLLKNFPVSAIRKQCKYILGVNVNRLTPEEYKNSLIYVAARTFHYVSVANTIPDRKICDLLIEPRELYKYNMFNMDNIQAIYDIGYRDAKAGLKDDKNLCILKNIITK